MPLIITTKGALEKEITQALYSVKPAIPYGIIRKIMNKLGMVPNPAKYQVKHLVTKKPIAKIETGGKK